MATNTADEQNERSNDASTILQYPDNNLDLHKLDVTFSHEMNLKQFDFNLDEKSVMEDQIFETEIIKSTGFSVPLETDSNPATFLKKFDFFYKDMKARLNLLKNTPVLKSQLPVASVSSQEPLIVKENKKLFKNLKNTPEVQEKLKHIKEFDDEIVSIIDDYKHEREERLQTQLELCNDICKNNIFPERDTQSFLDMCNFELFGPSENDDLINDIVDKDIEKIVSNTTKPTSKNSVQNYPNKFIKRNIELAKTGMLAGSSLTDEEKSRIELLLETDPPNQYQLCENLTESSCTNLDNVSSSTLNAYSFFDVEKGKLEDIDEKLEKFTEDEKEKEKDFSSSCDFNDQFIMEQALKRINEQLKELKSMDEKEMKVEQLSLSQKMNKIDKEIKELEDEDEQLLKADDLEKIDDLIQKFRKDRYTDDETGSQDETDDEQ